MARVRTSAMTRVRIRAMARVGVGWSVTQPMQCTIINGNAILMMDYYKLNGITSIWVNYYEGTCHILKLIKSKETSVSNIS